MSKFTPGPWHLDSLDGSRVVDEHYHSITAVCGYYSDGSGDGFEITGCISRENARLIAAAPDLLEALEDSLTALNIVYPNGSPVLNAAYAAIAKARGEA